MHIKDSTVSRRRLVQGRAHHSAGRWSFFKCLPQCRDLANRFMPIWLTHCVILQASTERSRRLYLRRGFLDIETWHGGFPVFLMWRPAGGGAQAAEDDSGGMPAA